MNKENISQMMDLLVAAYGEKAYNADSPEKMAKVMNQWTVMFKDDDPGEVLIAVKDCIATLQFAPKIADIKSRISQNRMAGQPTEMEAWAMVYKSVMESDGMNKARQLFDALPVIAQDLVSMPEQLLDWKEADGKTLTTVIASNFMRSYKVKAEREASYHALPADMQIAEAWKLPKRTEKPKELQKPDYRYDENGKRILNIGFEPPEYMIKSIQHWMDIGWTDAEIRKACLNWGLG